MTVADTLLLGGVAVTILEGAVILWALHHPRVPPAVPVAPVGPAPSFAPQGPPQGPTHYLVQVSSSNGSPLVLYDGHDSDAATAAWRALDRDPHAYPGLQEFVENGAPRVSRAHDEAQR